MERQFRGVALDIDGTLLDRSSLLSEEVRSACHQVVQTGIWLTLMTARPPMSVAKIAASVGSTGPWGCLNGSLVVDARGEILERQSIPERATCAVLERFARHSGDGGVSCCIYSGFDWLVPSYDARVALESDIVQFKPKVGLKGLVLREVDKILLIVEPSLVQNVRWLLADLRDLISIYVSKAGYIEITHKASDKAWALARCAAIQGVRLEQMVAVGDGENDVCMFEICGYSAAMNHSPPPVSAAASEVLAADRDCLADFLVRCFGLPPVQAVGDR